MVDKMRKGALVSNGPGKTTSYVAGRQWCTLVPPTLTVVAATHAPARYALAALEPRGKLFVGAGVDV